VNDWGWHLAISRRPVAAYGCVGGVATYPGVVVFDVGADSYARFMGRFSEPLATQFAQRAGKRVLDVGCGPGALTAELVQLLGRGAVCAIDPFHPGDAPGPGRANGAAPEGKASARSSDRSSLRSHGIRSDRSARFVRLGTVLTCRAPSLSG
jgi:SAM-dependent methyltransferase